MGLPFAPSNPFDPAFIRNLYEVLKAEGQLPKGISIGKPELPGGSIGLPMVPANPFDPAFARGVAEALGVPGANLSALLAPSASASPPSEGSAREEEPPRPQPVPSHGVEKEFENGPSPVMVPSHQPFEAGEGPETAASPEPGPEPEPEPERGPEPGPEPVVEEGSSELARKFPPLPPDIEQLLDRVGTEEGVDPVLLKALVRAESGGDTNAVSPAGARGILQATPASISDVGMDPEKVLGNPELEARAEARYLRKLQRDYGAKTPEEVIAAYNAGPRRIIGKDPESWPKESREHARRVMALMDDELRRVTPEEESSGEEAGERPVEEPATPREEPAEGELEKAAGEMVDKVATGEPLSDAEADMFTRMVAAEAAPEEPEIPGEPGDGGPAEPEGEGQPAGSSALERAMAELKGMLQSRELTRKQKLGLMALAITDPRMAFQFMLQREAGKQQAIQTGLQLLREELIGERQIQQQEAIARRQLAREKAISQRAEAQEEDRLFRNQVEAFHRRFRDLTQAMAKDGIEIPEDVLGTIPANIENPKDLKRAEEALAKMHRAYLEAKSDRVRKERKAADIAKAIDLTRKGGLGSVAIKSLYPGWEKDPDLRNLVEELEKQERLTRQQTEEEIARLRTTVEASRQTVRAEEARLERLRDLGRLDRQKAAAEAQASIARIEDARTRITEQMRRVEAQLGATSWWEVDRRRSLQQTLDQLEQSLDRLRTLQDEVSRLATDMEAGQSTRGPNDFDQETMYSYFQAEVGRKLLSVPIPGGPTGATIGWFVDEVLGKGDAEGIRKYGPAVTARLWQEALRVSGGRPNIARRLVERWIADVTSGAGWFSRTFGSGVEEREAEQMLNQQVPVAPPTGGKEE